MNGTEFKEYFNLLYNNINNNSAPGLTDSEINMFLTKGLNELVKQHVLGPATTYQLGINQTSKRDVELDSLIKTIDYTATEEDTNVHINGTIWSINYSTDEPLVILSDIANSTLTVIELSYALFNKFMAGAYKYPKKSQCWKIRHDEKFEIIAPNEVTINNIKQVYVKTPAPININATGGAIVCELPEVLHDEIVQRAVELAKAAYATQDVNVQLSMGLRSE